MSDFKLDRLTELNYKIQKLAEKIAQTVDKKEKRRLKHQLAQLRYLKQKTWLEAHNQQQPKSKQPQVESDFSGLEGEIIKLNRIMSGEDEKIEKAKEQLKRAINENFEREATKNICPICHSSVCHCEEEGE